MDNKIEIKYIQQKWDGIEAWVGSDETFWIRLDFFLEYFISNNVILSKKYKESLKDSTLMKKYYESLFSKFIDITSNGRKFDHNDYTKWLKDNKTETRKAIELINL